jgi:hypothetical protein
MCVLVILLPQARITKAKTDDRNQNFKALEYNLQWWSLFSWFFFAPRARVHIPSLSSFGPLSEHTHGPTYKRSHPLFLYVCVCVYVLTSLTADYEFLVKTHRYVFPFTFFFYLSAESLVV